MAFFEIKLHDIDIYVYTYTVLPHYYTKYKLVLNFYSSYVTVPVLVCILSASTGTYGTNKQLMNSTIHNLCTILGENIQHIYSIYV